ncbi:MAG: sugar phosphate isomerase/epimerase family protein [Bacillota bacterium]
MHNVLAFDTISIKNAPSTEEKVRVAHEAGFPAVELRGNDIRDYTGSITELHSIIEGLGLQVVGFVPEADEYDWHYEAVDKVVARALETFKLCEALEVDTVVYPVMSTDSDIATTTRNFRVLCHAAAPFGLKIGLEFIGHVPKVQTLETAWHIVKNAEEPNGGIVLDLFHFYRGRSKLDGIRRIPPDKVYLVHVDDAMDKPIEELVGAKHRLYPGEGVIPVQEIITVLLETGYTNPFVVELFNEDYWADSPTNVAERAKRTSQDIIALAIMGMRAQKIQVDD